MHSLVLGAIIVAVAVLVHDCEHARPGGVSQGVARGPRAGSLATHSLRSGSGATTDNSRMCQVLHQRFNPQQSPLISDMPGLADELLLTSDACRPSQDGLIGDEEGAGGHVHGNVRVCKGTTAIQRVATALEAQHRHVWVACDPSAAGPVAELTCTHVFVAMCVPAWGRQDRLWLACVLCSYCYRQGQAACKKQG